MSHRNGSEISSPKQENVQLCSAMTFRQFRVFWCINKWSLWMYLFIFVTIADCFEISRSPALPRHLSQCYQAKPANPPHSLAIFIELLQRVEQDPKNKVDIRVLATAMLHRFRVDGLERAPEVEAADGVIPWRPTGLQYARGTILLSRLLPHHSQSDFEYGFTDENLSIVEQCLLHSFLSPSVDPWQRGDEQSTCGEDDMASRTVENQRYSAWDPDVSPPPAFTPTAAISSCPLEGGVAAGPKSSHRTRSVVGDVTIGNVIAGIAAGLQRQAVPMEELISQRALLRYRQDGGQPRRVDNLMAATLAGDLAEVAAYQGPLFESGGMQMGPAGLWDDPLVPRIRRFVRKRPGSPQLLDVRRWEMTDAEIFGGIDGLALGSRIARLVQHAPLLRLSQLLEMYYSQRGVLGDPLVRVCQRGQLFQELPPDILMRETASFGYTLSSASISAPYISEQAIVNFSMTAVRTLRKYVDIVTNSNNSCNSSPIYETRANVYTIVDGVWSHHQALRFLMKICDGIDVSFYGSRIAVVNGGDGSLLSPLSPSRLNLSLAWNQIPESKWPRRLDLPLALSRVTQLLTETRENRTLLHEVCGDIRGDVIVVTSLAPVSDDDIDRAKAARFYLRRAYPDVRVLYVVPGLVKERFENLVEGDPLGQDAVLPLKSLDEEPAGIMVVQKIASSVSGSLFPVENSTRECDVLADTVSPKELRLYRILPEHFPPKGSVQIKVTGINDGSIRACLWRGVPTQAILASNCQDISATTTVTVTAEPPCIPVKTTVINNGEKGARLGSGICPPLYLSVGGADSFVHCYDDECRFPDEIRYKLKAIGLRDTGRNGYPIPGSSASIVNSGQLVWVLGSLCLFTNVAFVHF